MAWASIPVLPTGTGANARFSNSQVGTTTVTGTDWETAFTSGGITYDGNAIDAAAFAAAFDVTNGGQTLAVRKIRTPIYFIQSQLLSDG